MSSRLCHSQFEDEDLDFDSAPIMDDSSRKFCGSTELVAREGKTATHDPRNDSGFDSYSDFKSQFGIYTRENVDTRSKAAQNDSQCDSGILLEKFDELDIKDDEACSKKSQINTEWLLDREGCHSANDLFQQDSDGDTILHLSIVQGYTILVDALIEKSIEPIYLDIQNNLFQTPLHLAVMTGQHRIVAKLVKSGASLDLRDRYGNTALHLACRQGDVTMVEKLLSTPNSCFSPFVVQDLELRNYDGQMCVHVATLGSHIEVLKVLLTYGADINAQEGKGGRTPLHYAVEMNDIGLVKFLISECEARMDIQNFSGYLPIHLGYFTNTIVFEGLLKCFDGMQSIPSLPPSDSESDSSSEEGMDISEFDFKVNGQLLKA